MKGVNFLQKTMNKIKAILLDADGLVFKKQRYFSEIFAEQYGVSKDLILPFFKNNFRHSRIRHQ